MKILVCGSDPLGSLFTVQAGAAVAGALLTGVALLDWRTRGRRAKES